MAYLSDNPDYRIYFEENDGFLTKLNLMEISYRPLELHGTEAASQVVKVFAKYVIYFGLVDIEGSMKLHLKLKKKGFDISYADALGYFLSLSLTSNF